MFFIRQGATHKVVLGPAVAVGDGFTPVTNLVLTGGGAADEAEAILYDNGTVVDISGYTWAAIATADGYYHLTLHNDISGTVGHLTIVINDDSLCLPLRADFTVLDTAAYDANFKDAATGPALTTDVTTAHSTTDGKLDTLLTGTPTTKYMGPRGPGIYIDSGAANETTVTGTDGIISNPVSTFAAARTIADAIGVTRYYLEGNSDITLAATHVDWEFIGVGSVADNIVNLGSQDVSRSLFVDLTIEGVQGGAGRMEAIECALQDPGAGATTLHIFALRCGLVDDIEIDTSNNNVFDSCYSLVAGAATPSIIATGAAGTLEVRHYSGGLEIKALSASHNVSIEGMGQIVFNANCNVNANVSIRGLFTITDNTAGMASLTQDAVVNMPKINAEADTALSDYGVAVPGDQMNLAADAITAAKIANDAISSEHLNTGALTADAFAADALVAATFATGALTADAFAANALVAATFAASSLDGKGDWNTTTPPTAAAVVNEWETQSQADPTGFHVNVKEVNGTAQTANDNGADINAILADTGELQTNQGNWITATGFSTHDAAAVKTAIEAGGSSIAAIKAVTDALTAAAAAKLALSAAGIVTGAAEAGTLSTTQMTTDLSEATDDHYIGAVVVWTSGVLAGQRSDITDSAGANGLLTFTAVTEAASAGDTFVIV